MARPDERKFVTFQRGEVRDSIILLRFRNVLRTKVNPDTGRLFTEGEIALVTQEDSRFYVEADAIDLFGQAVQQRALWYADQVRPERAASEYLDKFHGDLWLPEGRLPATGGSGPVTVSGSPGTIYVGSTTLGDPTASVARDPAGKRYQVLVNGVIAIGESEIALNFAGVDTGSTTNPPVGTELTWVNPPLGSDPTCVILETFEGGFEAEGDADFAKRIRTRIRSKPGAGNGAQMRIWAQSANVAVEDAFVYSCAFHAGTELVAVVQKRGTKVGPLARVASFQTLNICTAFLVPPSSPVVPAGTHVLVTSVMPEGTDLALQLAMPKGSTGGWVDVTPWPEFSPAYPYGVLVTNVTSATKFQVTTDVAPEGGGTPALALWKAATSEFEELDVASVVDLGADVYEVTLNNAASFTPILGTPLSPTNARADVVALSIQAYFDGLGPGEVVGTGDVRFVRAARHPRPDQEYPTRAGQGIITALGETLGGALSDAQLSYISKASPTVPTSDAGMLYGPNMLVPNNVGIYPMDL